MSNPFKLAWLTTLLAPALLLTACTTEETSEPDQLQSIDSDLSQYGYDGDLGVFVIDNVTTKNSVVTFRRRADGKLTRAASYPTGGLGTGNGLGSQSALILSPGGRRLFVVNPGSNEISAFDVHRNVLVLRDIVPSGGAAPISLTLHDDLLYVLNAGSATIGGNITGFAVDDGTLTPLADSTQPLSAASVGPAQIAFNPAGSVLVVTEKATNNLTTYTVNADGTPAAPIVTASHGQTPFGFSFDSAGTLIVSEAFGGAPGASALSSYRLSSAGIPQLISGSVATGQTAACWVAISRNQQNAYTTNTGSNTVSGYAIASNGALTRFGDGGATATVSAGPLDLDFTSDGRFLYVLNGGGDSISMLRQRSHGRLDTIGELSGLPTSSVGIAVR
jgi:6-phosphogluconolactonase